MSDSNEKNKAMGSVRSKAVSALVEENRDRFNTLVQQYAKEAGIDWSPRPSKEERAKAKEQEDQRKAREQLEKLLEKNPGLRDVFAPQAEGSNLVNQDEDEG
jgi:ABC-type sugar transport system substrate-binding protein